MQRIDLKQSFARRMSALATLVVVLLPGLALHAESRFPMWAKPVAEDVYAVITPSRELPNPLNLGWNSNSAFVVTDSGVLLFDTGSSVAIGESIRSVIAEVTDQPVRWIVNSHAHGDHWLGNAAFKQTVERIYATKQVADRIRADGQGWVDRFDQMTEGASGQSAILVPDNYVDSRMESSFGDKQAVFLLSGNSHSPGDLLLWLPEQKVLLAGDVIYSDRMPSTMDSNLSEWLTLLGELEAMQPEVVVPGHGAVTGIDGVTRLRTLLQAFWDAVESGYAQGLADYEMTDTVIDALTEYEPLYPGLGEKVTRDISAVYLQVEEANF